MDKIRNGRAAALTFTLAFGLATGAAAAADEQAPLEKVAAAIKTVFSSQCDAYRMTVGNAASNAQPAAERITAGEMLKQTCDCVPQAIDAYVAATGPATLVVPAEAVDALKGATASCTAHSLRASTQGMCAAGLDPFARKGSVPISAELQRSRCVCLQAGIARLTDRQIVDASVASYADYRAKAKARAAGASDPPPSPNAMRDVEQACRAEEAAR